MTVCHVINHPIYSMRHLPILLFILYCLFCSLAVRANEGDSPHSWQWLDWLGRQWQQVTNGASHSEQLPNHRLLFGKESLISGKEYIVGIHPLHNPKRLFEVYGPIVDYINAQLPGVNLKLEASTNYEDFDKKL